MVRNLGICLALALVASVGVGEDAKVHKLSVSFATPNPSWKATVTGVREVGKELWVWVDATSPGGIALAVIGKAKAEATVTGPDLPVKYVVSGKTWGWKNKEEGVVFLRDLPEKERAAMEKAFAAGKLVNMIQSKDDK